MEPAQEIRLTPTQTALPGEGEPRGGTAPWQTTVYADRRGHLWRYAFDAADNHMRSIDPLGAITRWIRDGAHEVDRYTDPMGRFWDFVHDARGNLLDATDQFGRATHREYDALNNLTLTVMRWATR